MLSLGLGRISPDLVIHKTWLQVISRSGANGNSQKHRFKEKCFLLSKKDLMQSKGNDQFSLFTMREVYKEEVTNSFHITLIQSGQVSSFFRPWVLGIWNGFLALNALILTHRKYPSFHITTFLCLRPKSNYEEHNQNTVTANENTILKIMLWWKFKTCIVRSNWGYRLPDVAIFIHIWSREWGQIF